MVLYLWQITQKILAKLCRSFPGGHYRPTQLLIATGKELDIDDCQVLEYQPSVISRVIFHNLISLIINKYCNISLDVTDGKYFRTFVNVHIFAGSIE